MGRVDPRERKRKLRWIIPISIILVLLLSFSVYRWIIPRTELEVRVLYHEATGGGGTGGLININVLLTNWGNREVEDLKCSVFVTEEGETTVSRKSVDGIDLERGENAEVKLVINGNHYSTYEIELDLEFDCCGDGHQKDLHYRTHEDEMNIVFVRSIS